jgi:hypothetical protein
MSVVSFQAGVAEYVVDADLPMARKAIATAGDASREWCHPAHPASS